MRLNFWVKTLAACGAASAALTGCSLLGDDPSSTDDSDQMSIQSLLGGNTEDVDYAEQDKLVQEAIAECMRQEGWEYIPVDQSSYTSSVEYTDEDEVERIKREGFGIAYWTLNQDAGMDFGEEYVDPNSDYVMALSDDERTAYYESLYGTDEEQQAEMTTEVDPDTGEEYQVSYGYGVGCQGEGYTSVAGEDLTQSPEYWEAISTYYEELSERVEADPRMQKLTDGWSACMKDKGFEYDDVNSFYDSVYTEFQERLEGIMGAEAYADPTDGWTDEEINDFFESATQDEIEALYQDAYKVTDDQRTQLEAQLADEVELALAEHECSLPMSEQGQEIYADLEEQYALEHEDELRELAASFASGE